MLVGRGTERARIDALLDAARGGQSGALVVRGDPGIGKSALLRYAAERGEGFRVVRAIGVESESEALFGGLHELLAPLLHHLGALTGAHATALRTAFALGRAADVDRFAVAAAVIGLLAEASRAEPLLCLVDDMQWLDEASVTALRFACRRLAADQVVVLLAVRTGDASTLEVPELPSLTLEGIHREAAQALLAWTAPDLPEELKDRVLDIAEGNPLALLEVPRALRDGSIAGTVEPLPIGPRLEQAFARRADALDDASKRAVLLAAASDSGDLGLITAALADLALDRSALDGAERAGLVHIGATELRFSHPLVRSAVYQAASAARRRAVHRALANALEDRGPADRFGWHLALATAGPDETVAATLEAVADDARRRGGLPAAARALERSARLTPDPLDRSRRLVASAEAARAAGDAATARRLIDDALAGPCAEATWAAAQALLADLSYWHGQDDALLRMIDVVDRLAEADPAAAASVVVRIAMTYGPTDLQRALHLTERALELQPNDRFALTARANYLFRLGRSDDAAASGLAALGAARAASDWPGVSEAADVLAGLEQYDEAHRAVGEAIAGLRTDGALKQLSHALCAQVQLETRRGNLQAGYLAGLTAVELAEDLHEPLQVAFAASFLSACESWMGLAEATRRHAAHATTAIPARTSRPSLEARAALGILELQLGNPDAAILELEPVVAGLRSLGVADPGYVQALPELVEALIRAGRTAEAGTTLDELEHQAKSIGRRWAIAAAARCRAMLAPDDGMDDLFLDALERHGGAGRAIETARTDLAYGERLRRIGRRVDARQRLRQALATFEHAGARLLATRAARELAASGEHLRPTEQARDRLSPQELQVAGIIARGATNREAAGELFLSTKTIEFHLRNAYRKLGVRSRTELANALQGRSRPMD